MSTNISQLSTTSSDILACSIPKRFRVKTFHKKYPECTTEGGLRHQIFHSATNGMDEYNVVERIGRLVLINETNYFRWLEAINSRGKINV